jgi:hypothetical protein
MKTIRPTTNYLKNNARKNLALSIFCASITFLIAFSSIPTLPIYFNMGIFSYSLGVFSVMPLILGVLYWRKYRTAKFGYDGEKQVTETLTSTLSDDYHLINDVILPPYYRGNIDHIILSPRGIFAVETKNHSGKITCYGDEWLIQYRGKNKGGTEREFNFTFGSPSVQARNNAFRIKKVIESIEPLTTKKIWVQGIVVLSNNNSELIPNELPDSVEVKKINELPNYLKNYSKGKQLSFEEMELIEKEILQQAK